MKRGILLVVIAMLFAYTLDSFEIKKNLSFSPHSLESNYTYKSINREFQWDQIASIIDSITTFTSRNYTFGILQNYRNRNGYPPQTIEHKINRYNSLEDNYNTVRHQGIPMYTLNNDTIPTRYSLDGSLVSIISTDNIFHTIEHAYIKGIWRVPIKYLHPIEATVFDKIIFIDKTNQNITTLEYVSSSWDIKSMNPATTGQFKPPYKKVTPNGIFVLQKIKPKMIFVKDGTKEIGGYAPYASRFCGGAYIHGVPINYPNTKPIEFSVTLGTTPRSHMCVRNATSHAKFIYEWGEENKTLIIIIE